MEMFGMPANTLEDVMKWGTGNITHIEDKKAFLSKKDVVLMFEIAYATQGEQGHCVENTFKGYQYLREQGFTDVQVVFGFMVIHQSWRIQDVEHAWLTCTLDGKKTIIDPTLPFLLVTQVPDYFAGLVEDSEFIDFLLKQHVDIEDIPDYCGQPTLHIKSYKAAYEKAKHFAHTCSYPYDATVARKVSIRRMVKAA